MGDEGSLVRSAQRLELLTAAIQELAAARSEQAVIRIAEDAARRLTGADAAVFALHDGERCQGCDFHVDECAAHWVMERRSPLAIEDVAVDTRVLPGFVDRATTRSVAIVPVHVVTLGGAIACSWSERRRFFPEDLKILEALGESTGIALRNVRAYDNTRAIYEGLPHPALVWRRDRDVFMLSDWNRATHDATGGDVGAIGQVIPHLIDDLAECEAGEASVQREVRDVVLPGSSEPRYLRLTYSAVASDLILMCMEDTTEQRRTEEQLKAAQRLEAVGRLAGGVAHDFNNLLSVIHCYSSFALEQLATTDPLRADIEQIQQAGVRAAELTRQLLAFSRKQVMEPKIVCLNDIVRGLEGMLRRLLGEDIEVVAELAEELGAIQADPGQIEQVIMNLAVNARDAMPRGGTLAITTANTRVPGEGDEGWVRLVVSDNGCGMDATTASHAFEPFFTTKEVGKGTGLGLSTVYGIVKQSRGDITLRTEPGHGTAFEMVFPRVDAVPMALDPELAEDIATGGGTVLLVEDDGAVRRIAGRILRGAGYRVLAAQSASDAGMLWDRHCDDIDLLLTDVVMPVMSGPALAQRLLVERPGLRVLYMSGYTSDAIVEHGALLPGTLLLGKPFTPVELTRAVRDALRAASGDSRRFRGVLTG